MRGKEGIGWIEMSYSTDTHLQFVMNIGQQKPESIINRETACPFCARESLTDILAEDGPLLLLKNKYPVLQDTLQTVLIETDECLAEFSTYRKDHLHRLMRFALREWEQMERSGEFRSVVMFKSHGPQSGGTIRHPHMQIVGLKQIDYLADVQEEQFQGLLIAGEPGVELNISTAPRVGFYELNAILKDGEKVDVMADYVQIAAHYLMHNFHRACNSYNLFFYRFHEQICVKIMPRFIASPIYIGFSIPQVADRIGEVADQIRQLYFEA